jgi:acyl-coenzyme A thioesterase PaaI-like protein
MGERESHAPIGVSAEMAQTIDERANHCFGCGPENPEGLHLKFEVDGSDPEAITATCMVTMQRVHEGPPGYIHGGLIATLLDEAMSKLNRPLNVLAMTRSLSVDYLKPAPLYLPLRLVGRHVKRDGRKVRRCWRPRMAGRKGGEGSRWPLCAGRRGGSSQCRVSFEFRDQRSQVGAAA